MIVFDMNEAVNRNGKNAHKEFFDSTKESKNDRIVHITEKS